MRVMAPDTAVMSCRIKPGEPSDEVRWYRSGRLSKLFREIVNDEKYELRRDCDTLSLIIAVTDAPNDTAIYRCEAANKFGKVRTDASLVVLRTHTSTARDLRRISLKCFCTSIGSGYF